MLCIVLRTEMFSSLSRYLMLFRLNQIQLVQVLFFTCEQHCPNKKVNVMKKQFSSCYEAERREGDNSTYAPKMYVTTITTSFGFISQQQNDINIKILLFEKEKKENVCCQRNRRCIFFSTNMLYAFELFFFFFLVKLQC